VVIFPRASLEPDDEIAYSLLLNSDHCQRVYLDQLPDHPSVSLGLVQLMVTPPDQAPERARQDVALTHPLCQQANALFAMAFTECLRRRIAQAIKTGPSAEGLYEQVESWAVAVDPSLLEIIWAAASGPPADCVERQSWVLTALGNALWQSFWLPHQRGD
jgi:hypothetical protein